MAGSQKNYNVQVINEADFINKSALEPTLDRDITLGSCVGMRYRPRATTIYLWNLINTRNEHSTCLKVLRKDENLKLKYSTTIRRRPKRTNRTLRNATIDYLDLLRVSNNGLGDRIVDGFLDRLGLRNHIRLTRICKQR